MMPTRARMWSGLDEPFDVLVVGGGITGTGIARDAAMRGLRTALVEAEDFAFGTSSRSSKLVHGGLRYLEQYQFGLVFEAVSERRILMDIAPHLVHPLGFLFPVYEGARQPLYMIRAGMWVYDALSRLQSPKIHRTLSADDVARAEPSLRRDGLQGAPLYYDCATDDARLTLENALDAAFHGACVLNACAVTRFVRDESSGRVVGAEVADRLTGATRTVRAASVVNATGPWTDRTLGLGASGGVAPLLRPTKGVHLVVDAARLPVKQAVVCFHPADGRVLFAIPWGDRAYVGTTDTDFHGDPADVVATAADVTYLLDAANAYFPRAALTEADVISTWAGLRPLIAPPEGDGVNESSVSREHEVIVGVDGVVTIAGGKLTTYRRMAAETVDTVLKLLRLTGALPARLTGAPTDREPLPGAVGWPEGDDIGRLYARVVEASSGRLSTATARALVGTYGTRAVDVAARVAVDTSLAAPLIDGRPEILAQVDFAVDEELATTVADVLVRRTQVFFRAADQGVGAADVVAERIAARLGLADAPALAEAYRAEVAHARSWRGPTAPAADEAGAALEGAAG